MEMRPAPLAGTLRHCAELARKDLRLELRAREALLVTAPFGAVALLFVPMAVGTDTPLLREIGPGMYWTVVLLFGVLVTLRQSAVEDEDQLSLLRLCGVHPAVRLAGRTVANTVLLLAFQLVLAPVAVALYDPQPGGWFWLVPVLPLVAVGLAALGTLANALAHGLAGRTTLGPLLVVPVALPLLLGATQVPESAAHSQPAWPWLLLMLTVDVGVILAGALAARHLEEA